MTDDGWQPPPTWRGVEAAGRYIHLPGVLDRVHYLIGWPLTLRLIDRWGGSVLPIPRELSALRHPPHPLMALLGLPAALLLVTRLGRDAADPYPIPAATAELTWVYARRLRAQGHTVAEVRAVLRNRHHLRVTDRWIRHLTADIRRPPLPGRPAPAAELRTIPPPLGMLLGEDPG